MPQLSGLGWRGRGAPWARVERVWSHVGLGGGAVGPHGPGWRGRGATWAWVEEPWSHVGLGLAAHKP